MKLTVDSYTIHSYTIHNLTKNELDVIYAALRHFPSDNPRCYEAFLLQEKIGQYQSTVLANRERESNDKR